MDEGLKRRLVGATVLVSLVVIFVPMLLEDEPVIETGIYKTNIPPRPEQSFPEGVLPADDQELATPPVEQRPRIVPLAPPPPVQVAEPAETTAPATPGDGEQQAQKAVPAAEPAPVQPREGLSAWVVQVGSFSKRENAEKLVQQIRDMKYEAFMEQASVNEQTVFRVKVGPEIDHQLAEKMLQALNKDLEPLNLKGTLKSYP
ncbi:MAG: SPOR domain-containing protein [Sedimenticola sp.]|nr:SPOR domain-containing protein [Sedimenticola sp.]